MADFTIHYSRVCESNFSWQKTVSGSKGENHVVTWDEFSHKDHREHQYGWSCSCPAYKFGRGHCKHIKAVQAERCTWGAEAFCGDCVEANPDGSCPRCGGGTRVVKVAV